MVYRVYFGLCILARCVLCDGQLMFDTSLSRDRSLCEVGVLGYQPGIYNKGATYKVAMGTAKLHLLTGLIVLFLYFGAGHWNAERIGRGGELGGGHCMVKRARICHEGFKSKLLALWTTLRVSSGADRDLRDVFE